MRVEIEQTLAVVNDDTRAILEKFIISQIEFAGFKDRIFLNSVTMDGENLMVSIRVPDLAAGAGSRRRKAGRLHLEEG